MKAMICELCGGNEIIKQDGLFVCQHCGAKYSLEEAKKIIGSVTIDKSKEIENLYQLARRARSNNDSIDASKYYSMILLQDSNSWEAAFYYAYFEAMQYAETDIELAVAKVVSAVKTIIELQEKSEISKAKDEICSEVSNRIILIAKTLAGRAFNRFNEKEELKDKNGELVFILRAIHDLVYQSAQILSKSSFMQSTAGKSNLLNLYKHSMIILYSHSPLKSKCSTNIKQEYKNLRTLEPSYRIPRSQAKYLATNIESE